MWKDTDKTTDRKYGIIGVTEGLLPKKPRQTHNLLKWVTLTESAF